MATWCFMRNRNLRTGTESDLIRVLVDPENVAAQIEMRRGRLEWKSAEALKWFTRARALLKKTPLNRAFLLHPCSDTRH